MNYNLGTSSNNIVELMSLLGELKVELLKNILQTFDNNIYDLN